MDNNYDNYYDSYRNCVHLSQPGCGHEYTLCGFAFDEPASEHGVESMVSTDAPCNCSRCLAIAKELSDYLKRELKRSSGVKEVAWESVL